MITAIVQELRLRKDYLQDKNIETIYFGGGTPSLLSEEELDRILATVHSEFKVSPDAELTLECNPEDIVNHKLDYFMRSGINRLSIGIQTFNRNILQFLNRSHDDRQALKSVSLARQKGFDNITVDLMYALPGSDENSLKTDLETAVSLGVPHISAYCFTLEEKTSFGKLEKQGKFKKNEDTVEQIQYNMVVDFLAAHGFEQYEISNFARNGCYSRHNTSYWFGKSYLGTGPGAHSFNGTERQWNISNNNLYIDKLQKGVIFYETETLTDSNRFNEGVMTGLRTRWGVDTARLKETTGFDIFTEKKDQLDRLQKTGLILQDNQHLFLTARGKLLGDGIVLDLII